MNEVRRAPHWLLTLFLAFLASGAFAQAQPQGYQPQVGQAGKDVVWVPTGQGLVDRMLDMAKVTSSDFVMDLGSGDGRTVITAAKRGARALGIEYNPDMVELSKHNAATEGVSDKATFIKADLFETDFSRATVVTMFLLPSINLKLRPKILDLKPGTRIVSNTFTMGDWTDDETVTLQDNSGCSYYCTAHLWIVPAKVAGPWRIPQGELILAQNFQMVTGTLKNGDKAIAINDGKLRGDQLHFTAGGAEYTANVNGDAMEGTVKSGRGNGTWRATRAH